MPRVGGPQCAAPARPGAARTPSSGLEYRHGRTRPHRDQPEPLRPGQGSDPPARRVPQADRVDAAARRRRPGVGSGRARRRGVAEERGPAGAARDVPRRAEREGGRPPRRGHQGVRRGRRGRHRRRQHDRRGQGGGLPGRHPVGQLPDGRLHRRPVQRAVGDLHRGRGVRGVPVLPAEPRPRARRLAGRRQRAGRPARRGRRRRAGHLAGGPRHGPVELQHDGGRAADADRDGAGEAQLGCAVGQRAAGRRRRARPPGHARARQGDRGEHPALRPRVRVGRARRRARDPQRAHRRRGHARARARAEGEHRLGDPARPRGCPDERDPRLRRVHHPRRAAEHVDRGRPAAPTTSTRSRRSRTPRPSRARRSTRCRSRCAARTW